MKKINAVIVVSMLVFLSCKNKNDKSLNDNAHLKRHGLGGYDIQKNKTIEEEQAANRIEQSEISSHNTPQTNSLQSGSSDSYDLSGQISTLSEEYKMIDKEMFEIDVIEQDHEKWQKFFLLNPQYSDVSYSVLIPLIKYKGYNNVLSNFERLEYKIEQFKRENSYNLSSTQSDKIRSIERSIDMSKGLLKDKIFYAKSAIDFNSTHMN